MNKTTKTIIWLVIIIVVIAGIWWGVSRKLTQLPATEKKEVIKIGVILPLSGKLAIAGEQVKRGILLAEDIINKENLTLIFEDSKGDPKEAITAFTKLIDVDNVKVVIGPFTSGEVLATAPIAQEKKIILMAPIAMSSKINDAGDYIFKMHESSNVHAQRIVEIIEEKGFNHISILHNNVEYCTDAIDSLLRELTKSGIDILNIEKYTKGDTDFRSQLTKIKNKNPDTIFLCGYYKELGLILKQMKELGIKKQVFSTPTFKDPSVLETAGEAAEGVIYTTKEHDCTTQWGEIFCEKYKEKYHEEPSYRVAYGFDSLMILYEAIKKVGTDPERLKTELLKTDFNGAMGKTIFDKKGNAQRNVVAETVRNGKFVPYKD